MERQYDRKVVVGEVLVQVIKNRSTKPIIDEKIADAPAETRKKKRGRPRRPKMRIDRIKDVKYRPLKDREERRIPHWFSTPAEVHALIQGMSEKVINPDTITREFTVLVEDDPEEVRLAAVHSTIHTMYRFYVEDTREFDEAVWTPESGGAA